MPVPRQTILFVFYLGLLFGCLDLEAFSPNSHFDLRRIGQSSTQSSRIGKYGGRPISTGTISSDLEPEIPPPKEKSIRIYHLPRTAYRIYRDYAKRLWKETDVSAREKIADDKIRGSIRSMQQLLLSNEYARLPMKSDDAKLKLIEACRNMEEAIQIEIEKEKPETKMEVVGEVPVKKKEKKQRSILFGAVMGATVACWVFSGNYIFTGVFTLMTILGQLEYYRMIMNTGVSPARRISVVGACSMFLTVRSILSRRIDLYAHCTSDLMKCFP
jgi:hypothetical protein